MKYLYNLKLSVKDINNIKEVLLKKLNIKENELIDYKIIKRSIDARDKNDVFYNMRLELNLKNKNSNKKLEQFVSPNIFKITNEKYLKNDRPIVVGFGPSGMFSALVLAYAGAKPIVIERGSDVDKRKQIINNFYDSKILDEESNIVFGEGGAGTFSDGKLQSNIKNEYNNFVLSEFVKFGADESILIDSLPHIGTDILEKVVKNMRLKIIELGGEFFFDTKFLDYEKKDNILFVKTINREGEIKVFSTKHLILGIGHSARDTYKMLHSHNLLMEPKAFSMGVRIEHLQSDINNIQYGKFSKYLPAAPYKLACHLEDRSIYTFCMCPGGYVMPSQNEKGTIVTNGMSYSKRDGFNANSALLVEVKIEDYYKNSVLDGIDFQEKYEKLAFEISKDYRVPINLLREFCNDEVASSYRKITPTIKSGFVFADLRKCLPDFVVSTIKEGIKLLDKKMSGFYDEDAVLSAVESRSSAPLRILRNDFMSSEDKIYVIGEGAGYAGGIMTSAIDGIKCALHIIKSK